MQFGPLPLEQALGHTLGHNVAGPNGRRILRKGRVLDADDIGRLHTIGRTSVYVAQLAADDVDENAAAFGISRAVTGQHMRFSRASTGRVNIYAELPGVLRINLPQLATINRLPGVTLATLPNNTVVQTGKMVATLKIIPYAISAETNASACQLTNMLTFTPLRDKTVALILSGFPTARDRIVNSFENALKPRLALIKGSITSTDFVPLEDEAGELELARVIAQRSAEADLLILAGETAIMDRADIAPRAVEQAGGVIECFGAPVDPGNLLLLAYKAGTPIVGAPGCARSPKDNIVDLVLPRLLVGDHLTHEDIIAWAAGGLLEDVPERPLPRSRLT